MELMINNLLEQTVAVRFLVFLLENRWFSKGNRAKKYSVSVK